MQGCELEHIPDHRRKKQPRFREYLVDTLLKIIRSQGFTDVFKWRVGIVKLHEFLYNFL